MRKLFERNKHLLLFLVVANLLQVFGHNVWRAMFNNFAVEEIGISATANIRTNPFFPISNPFLT